MAKRINLKEAKELSKKDRVKLYGEVFTPVWLVNDMLDMLEKENADVFKPEKTFLDPAVGEGVFPMEILKRKFSKCKSLSEILTAVKSIYCIDILPDNVIKTRENIYNLVKETCEKKGDKLRF